MRISDWSSDVCSSDLMDMNFRSLRVEPATRKNFAPYGVLVGVDPAVDSRTGEFYGDKVELWAPGGFVSDEQTRLSVARIHARPPQVIWMERHFKHTQTFIPDRKSTRLNSSH